MILDGKTEGERRGPRNHVQSCALSSLWAKGHAAMDGWSGRSSAAGNRFL